MSAGGTITHHHAVGRVHRQWYDRQRPDLFAQSLKQINKPSIQTVSSTSGY